MQDSLPTDKYMTKVKETQKREYEVNLKDNRFWLNNVLNLAYTNEIDPKFVLERPKWVEALTPQDIQNTAKKYFKTDNYLKFVLYPEK
jgi:predicted Zn-dependent peptidase